ncbi:MAG: hypothetical protein JW863_20900 [Chitinispirillaceae bacterium]|nr:hypothetical protein [Chitinispirillaceae bacterium]
MITEKKPYSEPPAPLPQKEILSTGSLHIIAPASNAKIYLDGKPIGTGECTVSDIPIGQHVVFIQDGKKEHTLEAYTVEGVTRTITVKPERETFVNIMSTYSNAWCHGVRAAGPSLDIGVQHKASYYGINFHWGFFNDWYGGNVNANSKGEGNLVGGAALQWYYTVFNYKDYLEVAPGLASGFWYFGGHVYNSDYDPESYYDYGDYFDELFFSGPSLRLCAGFKRVYFTCAYTMLIGSNLGHVLVLGTRVVL